MALPGLLSNGRGRGLLAVSALALAGGAAAGAAAFATRGLFEALHGAASLPAALLVTLAASGLLIAATRVSARVMGEWLGQSYTRDIRLALFEHAAGMAASDVARRRNGYMSLRFVGDMTAFRNWIGLGLPRLVAGAILIPLALAVLWSLAPVFAWLTLPLVTLALVLIGLGGLRLRPLHRRLRARRARIAVDMAERMPLAPELDRLGRRRTEMGQLDHRIGRMIRAAIARLRLAEALKAVPDAIAGLAAMLIILGGFRTGESPGVIAGGLAAFGLMISPVRDLATVWNLHSAWRSAAIKADAALSRQQRETYTDRCSFPGGAATIAISDLALPSGKRLDLELAAASVGATELNDLDSSFLFSALNGLEKIPEGVVTLSGVCLRRFSRGSLRRSVVTISAKPPILQGSFRRALTFGVSRRLDDAGLEALARASGLSDALSRLGGLDGKLSEGGQNLLFSERALVSLVRARQLKPRLILVESQIVTLDSGARDPIMNWVNHCGATLLFQRGVEIARSRLK